MIQESLPQKTWQNQEFCCKKYGKTGFCQKVGTFTTKHGEIKNFTARHGKVKNFAAKDMDKQESSAKFYKIRSFTIKTWQNQEF